MNINKLISKNSVLVIALVLAGCSSKEVMVPANPNLDPLPESLTAGEVQTQEGPDAMRAEQWNMDRISLAGARAMSQGSYKVKVAVISSGIDYNHEDLKGNMYLNQGEIQFVQPASKSPLDFKDNDQNGYVDDLIGFDFVDHDGLPFDRSGMGTAAAGVIGAVVGNSKGIEGIAGKVSLVPVRYIDTNGNGSLEDLFDALEYVSKSNVDVAYLNLVVTDMKPANSWMSEEESAEIIKAYKMKMTTLLEAIQGKGIPLVVSAGSASLDIKNHKGNLYALMSTFRNVVFVTSVNEKDERPFIANYGMQMVAIAAPGTQLLTTLPGNKYGKESGTHMAAAHVAGAMALALSGSTRVNTEKLISSLLSRDGSDEATSLEFETMSGNRLNIEKYLKLVLKK